MSTIPESHQDLLDKCQVVILGTLGPHGEPQVTALWFMEENGVLRMSINSARQKLKNLQADPRASAFFIDPTNPYRTLELRGEVSIEPDPDYAFATKVGARYGGANLREMDKPGETRSVVSFDVKRATVFG